MGARLVQAGLLGWIAGVGIGAFFHPGFFLVFLILAVGVGLGALFSGGKGVAFFVASIFCASGFLFFGHTFKFWESLPEHISFSREVYILSLGENKVFYRPVTVTPLSSEETLSTSILLQAPLTFHARPGDIFFLQCTLTRPENFDPHFDYRTYLETSHVGYQCVRPQDLTFERSPWFSLSRSLFLVRERVGQVLEKALPEPEAGLALGLTLGGNDFLSQDMKQKFSRTGLSHIVAVSGYNMTLLVQFTLVLGLLSGLWRKQALILSSAIVFLFLLLIGVPASALRAALMTGIACSAFFFGRLSSSPRALYLAVALMLLANPLLIRDVGFELSVLATLALLLGTPLFERLLPLERFWAKGAALFLYTLLIELFTYPVLFNAFEQASWLAPLTNLLVLPLVPLAMLLLLLLLPFFFLFSGAAPFLAFPLWGILHIQIQVIEFFSGLSFGTFQWGGFHAWGIIFWYAGVFLTLFFFRHLKQKYVLAATR